MTKSMLLVTVVAGLSLIASAQQIDTHIKVQAGDILVLNESHMDIHTRTIFLAGTPVKVLGTKKDQENKDLVHISVESVEDKTPLTIDETCTAFGYQVTCRRTPSFENKKFPGNFRFAK